MSITAETEQDVQEEFNPFLAAVGDVAPISWGQLNGPQARSVLISTPEEPSVLVASPIVREEELQEIPLRPTPSAQSPIDKKKPAPIIDLDKKPPATMPAPEEVEYYNVLAAKLEKAARTRGLDVQFEQAKQPVVELELDVQLRKGCAEVVLGNKDRVVSAATHSSYAPQLAFMIDNAAPPEVFQKPKVVRSKGGEKEYVKPELTVEKQIAGLQEPMTFWAAQQLIRDEEGSFRRKIGGFLGPQLHPGVQRQVMDVLTKAVAISDFNGDEQLGNLAMLTLHTLEKFYHDPASSLPDPSDPEGKRRLPFRSTFAGTDILGDRKFREDIARDAIIGSVNKGLNERSFQLLLAEKMQTTQMSGNEVVAQLMALPDDEYDELLWPHKCQVIGTDFKENPADWEQLPAENRLELENSYLHQVAAQIPTDEKSRLVQRAMDEVSEKVEGYLSEVGHQFFGTPGLVRIIRSGILPDTVIQTLYEKIPAEYDGGQTEKMRAICKAVQDGGWGPQCVDILRDHSMTFKSMRKMDPVRLEIGLESLGKRLEMQAVHANEDQLRHIEQLAKDVNTALRGLGQYLAPPALRLVSDDVMRWDPSSQSEFLQMLDNLLPGAITYQQRQSANGTPTSVPVLPEVLNEESPRGAVAMAIDAIETRNLQKVLMSGTQSLSREQAVKLTQTFLRRAGFPEESLEHVHARFQGGDLSAEEYNIRLAELVQDLTPDDVNESFFYPVWVNTATSLLGGSLNLLSSMSTKDREAHLKLLFNDPPHYGLDGKIDQLKPGVCEVLALEHLIRMGNKAGNADHIDGHEGHRFEITDTTLFSDLKDRFPAQEAPLRGICKYLVQAFDNSDTAAGTVALSTKRERRKPPQYPMAVFGIPGGGKEYLLKAAVRRLNELSLEATGREAIPFISVDASNLSVPPWKGKTLQEEVLNQLKDWAKDRGMDLQAAVNLFQEKGLINLNEAEGLLVSLNLLSGSEGSGAEMQRKLQASLREMVEPGRRVILELPMKKNAQGAVIETMGFDTAYVAFTVTTSLSGLSRRLAEASGNADSTMLGTAEPQEGSVQITKELLEQVLPEGDSARDLVSRLEELVTVMPPSARDLFDTWCVSPQRENLIKDIEALLERQKVMRPNVTITQAAEELIEAYFGNQPYRERNYRLIDKLPDIIYRIVKENVLRGERAVTIDAPTVRRALSLK